MLDIAWWMCLVWLSSLLCYSALFKLADYSDTPNAVARYRLLPPSVARPTGYALPIVEAATVALLLTSATRLVGAIVSAALGAIFMLATVQVVVRRIDISCGCIGRAGRSRSGWISVARAAAITAASVFVAVEHGAQAMPSFVALLVVMVASLPAVYYVLVRRHLRRQRAPFLRVVMP